MITEWKRFNCCTIKNWLSIEPNLKLFDPINFVSFCCKVYIIPSSRPRYTFVVSHCRERIPTLIIRLRPSSQLSKDQLELSLFCNIRTETQIRGNQVSAMKYKNIFTVNVVPSCFACYKDNCRQGNPGIWNIS